MKGKKPYTRARAHTHGSCLRVQLISAFCAFCCVFTVTRHADEKTNRNRRFVFDQLDVLALREFVCVLEGEREKEWENGRMREMCVWHRELTNDVFEIKNRRAVQDIILRCNKHRSFFLERSRNDWKLYKKEKEKWDSRRIVSSTRR